MASAKTSGRFTKMANRSGGVPRIVKGGTVRKVNRSRSRKGSTRRRTFGAKAHTRRRATTRRRNQTPKAAMSQKGNPTRFVRRRHHRKGNPIFSGMGDILRQIGYGSLGAFFVSTATQLLPFALTSPIMVFLAQLGLSLVAGWIGTKIFGASQGGTIRIGAFAFTGGNAVQNFLPNLQGQILALSPIKAAPRAIPAASTPVGSDQSNGVELVDGMAGLADIEEINRGQFGAGERWYTNMGDVYEVGGAYN